MAENAPIPLTNNEKENLVASRISAFDRSNAARIITGEGDWMSARILQLLRKADQETLEQFRLGFPDHVELFEQWKRGEL